MRIILASGSPRRRELLTQLGVDFEASAPQVDETCAETAPEAVVEALAERKARAVQAALFGGQTPEDVLIIGCDTVVCCDGEILGKPKNPDDAERMLTLLAGRTHHVVSGLCLICGERRLIRHADTAVCFDPVKKADIRAYVASGEPADKAGGYAIQGGAARWISAIHGCYYNVVGLPINLLCRMADELSVEL